MAGQSMRLNNERVAFETTPKSILPAFTSSRDGKEETGFQWIREALGRSQNALEMSLEGEELHRLLFEKVPHPRFVCDAKTLRILVVNEAAIQGYGYSRSQFLNMKVTDLAAPECVADFKKYCRKISSSRFVAAKQEDGVFRHRKQDGKLMDIEVNAALIPLRHRRMFLLLAQDVTEQRRAMQRLRAQQDITHALAESSTLAEASPKVFHAICENLGCDWGELWRVDPTAQGLRCTQTWHPKDNPLPAMQRSVRNAVFCRGEGIAGTVWARNKPVWISRITQHPEQTRAAVMKKCGLQTVFAFPIRLNKEVLGVISIFKRQVLPPDKYVMRMLKDICSQVGQVMGRRRAERRLLQISEDEQQRIGQDLHDSLCQQLAGLAYIANTLENDLSKDVPARAVIAARISELARETAVQARQIARGLNPVNLVATGLMAALNELVVSIESLFSISCRFECPRRVLVPHHKTAVHLYRITQEAIHNSITHGKATEIVVSLRREPGEIILGIADNGRGFPKAVISGDGTGLENMNYRARAIGARLHFRPRTKGGTVVQCEVPNQMEGENEERTSKTVRRPRK
jgi:PAS domain S-box-containing protein